MKFTCNTKELSEACSNVMRAVSTKVTIPTIEGILMECGSDTLSLTGYDFEFGINTTLQASVVEPGAIVINAKVISDIIRKLPEGKVTFEIWFHKLFLPLQTVRLQSRYIQVLNLNLLKIN